MASLDVWNEKELEEDVSYLSEMLTSKASVFGGLGALAAGAVLSIPLGLGIGAVPLLAYAAAEGIAALFVPSSPVFQEFINRKKRRERREASRAHLIGEIERRVGGQGGHWNTYARMHEHLASLKKVAENRTSALTDRDVEKLDDATVAYLGMWLARLVIRERWDSIDGHSLRKKLKWMVKELENVTDPLEKKRLEKATADMQRVINSRDKLRSRELSVEAAMVSMADTFEEVYQRVMTDPTAVDVSTQLKDAVARMHFEEELDLAVEGELNHLEMARRQVAAKQGAGQS